MKTGLGAAALALCLTTGAWAEGMMHKVAVHVDQNDPQVLNMALNNVQNLASYYKENGDQATVEIVAYGPGLMMFVEGKSPVADRISAMALELEHVTFSACENTLENMKKKQGQDIALLDEARIVPSGVVRLIELQEQGYAYVRP
ncbi:hypothetical protein ATO6_18550 [Oceanicola sp. 22II-s10i]|nr:hypothetical protein ATO6_18550 [Oceanicola sp. 22II-s10i]